MRDIASEWYFGRELVMGILMEQSKNGIDKKEKREREKLRRGEQKGPTGRGDTEGARANH